MGAEDGRRARLQVLEQECKAQCDALAQSLEEGKRDLLCDFTHLRDQLADQFSGQVAKLELMQSTFTVQMQEAFENFRVSAELEQTKRLRQIGDFIARQKLLLGQINFNEKNYEIF